MNGSTNFKNKIMGFINGPVMKAFSRLGAQRHLLAIRNGIVSTIPFVIIGATFLLILNFPLGKTDYLKNHLPAVLNNFLLYGFRGSMGIMGLMAAWGIASELGKTYKFSQTSSGLLGVFAFLLMYIPTNGGSWQTTALGGGSIFSSIIAGIVAVEIFHFCHRFKITIKMPAGVPDAVANSFASLVPVLFVSLIFGGTRYMLGFDASNFIVDILKPMQNFLTGGLGGAIVIIIFVTLFWWVGIHGTSMIGSVVRPIWQKALTENTDWFNNGRQGNIPHIASEQFLQWFVWIGGAGATIGLIIAGLIFARSEQLKTVTRVSAVPALFNINEPVIFGIPIILNPFLLIPFILAPVAMCIISYLLATWMGTSLPLATAWTLPAPIGAYFSSGGSWKAIIITLVGIATSVGIWTPFIIAYDRKLRKEEKEGIEAKAKVMSEKDLKKKSAKAKGKVVANG